MILKEQVCTIEQGLKLEKLGILPISVFQHYNLRFAGEWKIRLSDTVGLDEVRPAYTVAELGVMLPSELPAEDELIKMLLLQFQKPWEENEQWLAGYLQINTDLDSEAWVHTVCGNTEAECRANMLIYLLENKLITLEACNMALAA